MLRGPELPRKGPDLHTGWSRRLPLHPEPHMSSGPTLQYQTVSRRPSKLLIEAITPRRRSLHCLFQPPPTRIGPRADHQIILSKKKERSYHLSTAATETTSSRSAGRCHGRVTVMRATSMPP